MKKNHLLKYSPVLVLYTLSFIFSPVTLGEVQEPLALAWNDVPVSYEQHKGHDRHEPHQHHERDHHKHHGKPEADVCGVGDLYIFFKRAVSKHKLVGVGHKGHRQLKVLRKLLKGAKHAVHRDNVERAVKLLQKAYALLDDEPPGHAKVGGPAAAELAARIMTSLQCLMGGSSPSAQVVNNSGGLLTRALVGGVEFTTNLDSCGTGCSTEFIDVAEGSNEVEVLPQGSTVVRQIGSLGPFEPNKHYAVNIILSDAVYCAELWHRLQTSTTFNDDTTRVFIASVCEAAPPTATISGTAAAGAALAGIVTIRDSSIPFIERSVPIDMFGYYEVDVTGMTGPFMLRAEGTVVLQSYSIYSAAVDADIYGNVNITPLTDLIVSNVAGQIAAAAYAAGNFGAIITDPALQAQQVELQEKLLPVLLDLGLEASIDILRAVFNADHTGMDLLLDALRVEVDPVAQAAIITNIINGSQTTDNFAALDPTGTLTGAGTAAGMTQWDFIRNVFQLWTDAYATELPSPETLEHLFDPAFVYMGDVLSAFLTEITTNPTLIGADLTNVALNTIYVTTYPYTATVTFTPVIGGIADRPMKMNLSKQSDAAPWLMTGDGRVGQAMITAMAEYHPDPIFGCETEPLMQTGLKADISSPLDLYVDYAVVKGPGLPVLGHIWFKEPNDEYFHPAAHGAVYDGVNTPRACGEGYFMDDATIASIPPNAMYTIEYWDDMGTVTTADDTLLHIYAEFLPVAPVNNTSLSTASFAQFVNPFTEDSAAAAASSGGTFNAQWIVPAGITRQTILFFRSQDVAPEHYKAEQQLAPTVTNAAIAGIPAPTGTVTSYGYSVAVVDMYFRQYWIWVHH